MARGWGRARGKSHAPLSQRPTFLIPKKNKGESFLHWCVGLHGGASAAGGRQAIYCGHARGAGVQAGRSLAHLACRAKQHCLSTYGEKLSAPHQPARHAMHAGRQAGRSASARKAREGETRAKRQQLGTSKQIGLRLRLFAGRAAHSGDRSSCMSPKGRRSGSPKRRTSDMLARAQTGHWLRLPAFFAISCCSHACDPRVSNSSSPPPPVRGIGQQSSLCSPTRSRGPGPCGSLGFIPSKEAREQVDITAGFSPHPDPRRRSTKARIKFMWNPRS